MAQYDGSIRIKTEITTKQAEVQLSTLQNRIVKTADTIESLRSKMDALKNAKIPTEAYVTVQKQIDAYDKKFGNLIDKQEKFLASGGNKEDSAYKKMTYDAEKLEERIAELEKHSQNLVDNGKAFTLGNTTEEFSKLGQQLQYEENNLSSMVQKRDLLITKIQAQEEEEQRIADIKENANVADQELVDLLERRKQILQEIYDLERAGVTEGYQEYDTAIADLSDVQGQINSIREIKYEASEARNNYVRLGDSVKQAFQTIGRGLIDIPIAAVKAGAKGLISIFQRLGGIVKNIGKNSFKAFGTIAQKAFNGIKKTVPKIISGVKKLGNTAKNSFLKINKSAKKTNGMLSRMSSRFKGLALSLLIFNNITKIFNSVTSSIKDGFENLYKDNEKFKNSINELKASTLTLKNAFAAAFRPLVDIAIPYIQKVSEYMTQLIDKVGQFTAAITGQKTYTKAIKQTADAFEDAEEAADGYLSPLDEINKYQTSKKEEEDQTGLMFEEVPISDKFKDIAQWFKDMWKNSNFSDLGELLGEKLKNALDNIPWNSIKDTANKIGKSIASFINGFVEVEGLGNSIGKTLAEVINTAFEFLNSFVHELHWDSVGKFIADSIGGFLNNIDWALIYDTFVTGAKGLGDAINSFTDNFDWNTISKTIFNIVNTYVDTWYTFLTTVDWAKLGTKVGEQITATFEKIDFEKAGMMVGEKAKAIWTFILNALENIDWQLIGQKVADFVNGIDWDGVSQTFFDSISTAFNGAVDAIYEFVTNIDWVELGKTIGTNLYNAFESIDWKKTGETLSDLFISFFDFITSAIESIDWWQVGESVKELLVNIDWASVAESLFEAIGAALGGLAAFIGGLIGEGVENARIYFEEKIKEAGGNVVEGILVGISEALVSIGDWIYQHVFEPFMEGFKSAFGIHSPSTIMAEMGGFIIEGMFGGIIDALKNIGTWIKEHIFNPFVDNFKSAFGIHSPSTVMAEIGRYIIEGLLNGLKDTWNNITSWLNEKIQWIKNKFSSIKDTVGGLFSSDSDNSSSYSSARKIAYPSQTVAALSNFDIPGYATGQVIPRTMKQHLAVLGDNSEETEVVSPLSTMKQALKEAMVEMGGIGGSGNIKVQVMLDKKVVGETMVSYGKIQQMSTGSNPFLLGTT